MFENVMGVVGEVVGNDAALEPASSFVAAVAIELARELDADPGVPSATRVTVDGDDGDGPSPVFAASSGGASHGGSQRASHRGPTPRRPSSAEAAARRGVRSESGCPRWSSPVARVDACAEQGPGALADALAEVTVEAREIGARRLLLAVTWADQHVPLCQQDRGRLAGGPASPPEAVCACQQSGSTPGWRRRLRVCRRPGSEGTPAVSTSGVAELGVHLATSTVSASLLLGDALDLRHRHPRLWRRVLTGEVEDWQARRVARLASPLSPEDAEKVDVATAHVLGALPWGRALDVVQAAVVAADPSGYAERVAESDERRYASAGRYRGTDEAGNRTFTVRTSAGDVARFDALVQHLADLLASAGDGSSLHHRRTKAFALLANPAQACVLLGASAHPDQIQQPGGGPEAAVPAAPAEVSLQHPDADQGSIFEPEPEPEPELTADPPDEGPPTAVQVAAAFGRLLSERARRDGGSSAWDLLRPPTSLVFHLAADSHVVRMSDTRGPLGPIGSDQLRSMLAEQLPDWLADHLTETPAPAPAPGPSCSPGEGSDQRRQPRRQPRRRRVRLREQVVVTPLLDIAGQVPVDAYEVPDRMRRALSEATPFEVFPWGTADARRSQADHTTSFVHRSPGGDPPPGQTRLDNLGPLAAGHHNLKTHGGWRCHQPLPGLHLWQTPSGHWYRVDHTGSAPLGRELPEILRQQRERAA